ncbi:hypothetical protein ACFYZ5_44935 [Streptomyces chartreusis]|uniref:hypothetical protein n=1 Tax=Streptomyces chartreusis TaxID=1969 RepID=UPI0036BFE032
MSNAWWRFSDVVWNEQSTPEQWRAAFAEVHEAWTQFSTAVAAVAVAGPVTAAEAAEELRVAMYEWEKAGMDWFAAARREGHGRLDEYSERFQQAWQAIRAPDRAFQQAARKVLGTEEPWQVRPHERRSGRPCSRGDWDGPIACSALVVTDLCGVMSLGDDDV